MIRVARRTLFSFKIDTGFRRDTMQSVPVSPVPNPFQSPMSPQQEESQCLCQQGWVALQKVLDGCGKLVVLVLAPLLGSIQPVKICAGRAGYEPPFPALPRILDRRTVSSEG